MAYSPFGQGGRLLRWAALRAVASGHGVSPALIALAWCLRDGNTIAIPKAASLAHARKNAAAAEISLNREDLAEIDAAHKPPRGKQSISILERFEKRAKTFISRGCAEAILWPLNGGRRKISWLSGPARLSVSAGQAARPARAGRSASIGRTG